MRITPRSALRIYGFAVALSLVPVASPAQEATEPMNGLLTGDGFRKSIDLFKEAWTAGFYDGLMSATGYGATRPALQAVRTCLVGMNPEQLAAVFSKYLAENPSQWHKPMNVSAGVALDAMCKRRP
jgi:hypothetical protein